MPKLPIKKTTQKNYVKTALRLPSDLHAELTARAVWNASTLNAEMVTLLRSALAADGKFPSELDEIKTMLRKLLDNT